MKKLYIGIDESGGMSREMYVYVAVFSYLERDVVERLTTQKKTLATSELEEIFKDEERDFIYTTSRKGSPKSLPDIVPGLIKSFRKTRNLQNDTIALEIFIDGNIGTYTIPLEINMRALENVDLLRLQGFPKGKNRYNESKEPCYLYPPILEMAHSLAYQIERTNINFENMKNSVHYLRTKN